MPQGDDSRPQTASNVSGGGIEAAPTPILAAALRVIPTPALTLQARNPSLFLWIRMFVLLGVFFVVDQSFQRVGQLSIAGYEQPFLIVAVIDRLGGFKLGVLFVLLVALLDEERLTEIRSLELRRILLPLE